MTGAPQRRVVGVIPGRWRARTGWRRTGRPHAAHGYRLQHTRDWTIDTQLLGLDWSLIVSNLIHVLIAYLIALPIGWEREHAGAGTGALNQAACQPRERGRRRRLAGSSRRSVPKPFIQACVRSTTHRLHASSGAGTPRRAISPVKPRSSSSVGVTPRSYPRSRCTVHRQGALPVCPARPASAPAGAPVHHPAVLAAVSGVRRVTSSTAGVRCSVRTVWTVLPRKSPP